MNEWKKKLQLFFLEYGKVTVVIASIFISFVSMCLIVATISPQKLRVSFLDVGQGDAILIQTPGGHDMVIDGGPSARVLAQLQKKMGYFDRDIDVMIATHGDADHVTGLIPVLENYEVKTIVRSPIDATTAVFEDLQTHIKREGAEIHVGAKGDVIDFGDGVVAHVLYPNQVVSPRLDTNDASVSVVVTYGDHSFLLTGDLTTKYESQLIGSNLPKRVTVYKAGHHGSKTSSGEQLLTYVRPEYAVISAGKENRYGHPNADTLARLQKYSQEILTTIDRGTISFVSNGRMIEVETEK